MDILAVLSNPELWIAFFMLTALELVALAIDNIIFVSMRVERMLEKGSHLFRHGLFVLSGNA